MISEKIFLELIGDITYKSEVRLETPFLKLAIDSLKYMRIIVAMEKQYRIRFDETDLDIHRFALIGDMWNYIVMKTRDSANS